MSTCQSQPLNEKMELKEILESGLMLDIKYLLDNNMMVQSELEKVVERRNLFLKKKSNNDVNREGYMAEIHEELKLLDVCKFNTDDCLEVEERRFNYDKARFIIVNYINFMYFSMLKIHPMDLSSFEDFINFRFNNKFLINGETDMLHQIMADKHEDFNVYINTARSEYFNMNDIASARLCISEGLKFYKNCRTLHFESFNLELNHLQCTAGESLPFVLSKYDYIAECIKDDLEFYFTLLDNALRFNFNCELLSHVIRNMFEEYKQNEKMWQKLAVLTLNGCIYDFDTRSIEFHQDYEYRLQYSVKVFKDGLNEDWSTEKRQKLWNKFMNHIIDIWKKSNPKEITHANLFLKIIMNDIFQEAEDEGFLHKPKYYLYWALCDNNVGHAILEKAMRMDTNIYTWYQILSVYIESNSFQMVKNVFEYAVMKLGSESTVLWMTVEEYLIRHDFIIALFEFYNNAIYGQYTNISVIFRPNFLKLFRRTNRISATRKKFNDLIKLNPPCKQLYLDMITYEQTSDNFNKTQISKLYREVCHTMGHGDLTLWTNYIKFEYTHVDQYSAKNIYKSSLEYLGPDLFSTLTIEFENMKREYYESKTLIINPNMVDVDEA